MANETRWSFAKDETLIELVKCKPPLYDMQSPHYSDAQYKKAIWKDIERKVYLTGAKGRWEQLRAQYRKYLNKLKSRNGEPAAKISKWRFADQMMFLQEHINEEKPRSSFLPVNGIDVNFTEDYDFIERDAKDIILRENNTEQFESGNESVNNFSISTPMISQENKANETVEPESTSSKLMNYIMEKYDEERTAHPIEKFFSLMAETVKNFSLKDQHYVKTKVFALVSELEKKYLSLPPSPVIPESPRESLTSPGPS